MTPHEPSDPRQEQARAVVKKYQAEIDFNGWSDDLLEKVLTATIRDTEARVWGEAARGA